MWLKVPTFITLTQELTPTSTLQPPFPRLTLPTPLPVHKSLIQSLVPLPLPPLPPVCSQPRHQPPTSSVPAFQLANQIMFLLTMAREDSVAKLMIPERVAFQTPSGPPQPTTWLFIPTALQPLL